MIGTIERVVVALDAASENRAAIGTAARLAARWKRRLHAVFVEDDDLRRLAVLPFARQVTLGFGAEALTVAQAEQQLRAYAERARRELAAAAQRHGIEWSFEIVRDATVDVAAVTDFLVAGSSTRPIGGHFRLECRWWSVVEPSHASFLLAHHEGSPRGTVVAVLRGRDASAERLLAVAAPLAEAGDGHLTVVCPTELAGDPEFATWLSGRLAPYRVRFEVDPATLEPEALLRRLSALECRLVAIEAGAAGAGQDELRGMIARLSCDVVVVR